MSTAPPRTTAMKHGARDDGMRARQNIYEIPVTIGDERVLTVRARTPAEAKQKAREGKYLRLGKSLSRGFLTVGTPAPVERPRA